MEISSKMNQKEEGVNVIIQCYSMVKLPSAGPGDQGK
jgi:hypothetical protein